MVPMRALVGFSDRELITPSRPSGGVAANGKFKAPSADIAKRLETEGLAQRVKVPTQPHKAD